MKTAQQWIDDGDSGELSWDGRIEAIQAESFAAGKTEGRKAALSEVVAVGHNLDCIFCGFKDRLATIDKPEPGWEG